MSKSCKKGASLILAVNREIYKFAQIHQIIAKICLHCFKVTYISVYKHVDMIIICWVFLILCKLSLILYEGKITWYTSYDKIKTRPMT